MIMIKEKLAQHKKKLLFALCIVALILLSIILSPGKDDSAELVPRPVRVITVSENDTPVLSEYVGVIESARQQKIGFAIGGTLKELFVKEGDVVSAGQALASLNQDSLNRAYQASENTLRAAKEAYNFATDQYRKYEQLHEAGAISAQELERVSLELESQKAAYENAKLDFENKAALVADAFISSDFEGSVSGVLFETGEMVPAGQPVLIINSSEKIIRTSLAQNDLSSINRDTDTSVMISGQEHSATILSINSSPDPGTRTYPVELKLTHPASEEIMPLGALVTVNFRTDLQKAISIPLNIISNDGQDFVFVVDPDNRVQRKAITLGQVHNHEVIVYGLAEGDRVVSEGFKNIKQGEIVRIKD